MYKDHSPSVTPARLQVARGRPLDSEALAQVSACVGHLPARRDLLLEKLHCLNDTYGYLYLPHLQALAQRLGLAPVEVLETASFYAHFQLVDEGEPRPPRRRIRVCDSLSCQLAGAEQLHQALVAGLDPSQVQLLRSPCVGRCAQAPVAVVDGQVVAPADAVEIKAQLAEPMAEPEWAVDAALQEWCAQGGGEWLQSVRCGTLGLTQLCEQMMQAGLRGLGGAGFPAPRKWALVAAQPGPRYLVINADEGEPGTFKDRHCLEQNPWQVLEAALLLGHLIEVESIYLYLRDEYAHLHRRLRQVIAALETAGWCAPGHIQLRRGAGAYICGEESALIESLEGKPGKPRQRPPYVAERGLFQRPTLVNNVETLYWIVPILTQGADWFAAQGRRGHKGMRHFSVSGRVRRPGIHLAPVGITLNELLQEYCGGMQEGHRLLAYLPGGASGGILSAQQADLPLDFDTLQPYGCFLGSAAIIVLSDQDDLSQVARHLLRFFADESCGQCTPCRVGCTRLLHQLQQTHWDEAAMQRLIQVLQDASICGLGQAAGNPVATLLRHLPEQLPLARARP